jgi:hypothetical protein
MAAFKHDGENIVIGGLTIPLSAFLVLEPGYKYPSDLIAMIYDGKSRQYKAKSGSWIVPGRWEDGERYIRRSSDFAKLVEMIRKDDRKTVDEFTKNTSTSSQLRKTEYPSIESLIVALWEKVVEKRDDAAKELQAKREAVKAKYPLEEPVNVELQQRDNLIEGGTEGVRPKSKRTPRSRNKHSG